MANSSLLCKDWRGFAGKIFAAGKILSLTSVSHAFCFLLSQEGMEWIVEQINSGKSEEAKA